MSGQGLGCIQHANITVLISLLYGHAGFREKRALPETVEDVFNRLKRAKPVINAPPETAEPTRYKDIQGEPSERVLDDIPPVSLLCQGFGHFLDIVDGHDDVPGLADVDLGRLQGEVDDLATKMYFPQEDDRRDAALPCLRCIFSARKGTKIPSFHAAAIGPAGSDGHNIVIHGAGTMIVVFKNWSTGINAIPQVEIACYAARLNAIGMDESDARREPYR